MIVAQQCCCLLEVIRQGQKTEGPHQELQKPFNCQPSQAKMGMIEMKIRIRTLHVNSCKLVFICTYDESWQS